MLTALAANPTASFTDLSRPAREALSFAHPDAAITFLLSWRTKTNPLAAAVDPLIDFGAAVPAFRIVGPRWPGRERYQEWYLRRGCIDDHDRSDKYAGLIAALTQ